MKKRLVMLSIVTACAVTVAPAARAEENRIEGRGAGDGAAVDVAGDAPVHVHLTRDAVEAAATTTRDALARRTANMTYHLSLIHI